MKHEDTKMKPRMRNPLCLCAFVFNYKTIIVCAQYGGKGL